MRLLAKIAIFLALLMPVATPALAYNPLGGACSGGGSNSAVCNQNNKYQSSSASNPTNHIIQDAANIVAMVAGLAAVIIILISGLTMITSGGDQEKVKKARGMLTNAVIGLVIVSLAWIITTFIVQKLVS